MATPAPAQLRDLCRRDPALAAVLRRRGPFPGFPDAKVRRLRSHFQYLLASVAHQAVSLQSAASVLARMQALASGPGLPSAQDCLDLGPERLREAGLSGAKVGAILALAEGSVSGRLPLPGMSRWSDQRVVDRLSELPGIGEWTAQMFLIFRLGRLDVMPTGDLGVREGLRVLDGLTDRPTPRALRERAEVWRPLRSVASWVLWEVVHEVREAGDSA